MKLKLTLLLICTACFASTGISQQKHKGTLYTKLGQELQGEITVNLNGDNAELIEISSVEKTKGKRSKQKINSSSKLNTAIIKHILIEGKVYYFRDIKIGYDDKMMKNVCVQLVYGTIDCGLFQAGDGTGENSIAVKFPKAPLSELASVDFEYYHTSASVPMRISDCKVLLSKMAEQDQAVTWTETNNREQRIQRFKNIISAYNDCGLKN